MGDSVNHPEHYTASPAKCECGKTIECIQITAHMNFCLGNAVKYIWRSDLKGNAVEDLKKARWYINREIAMREAELPDEGWEDWLYADGDSATTAPVQQPSPTAHKYTREEFERMNFKIEAAKNAVAATGMRFGVFLWEHAPQGEYFWSGQISKFTDEGRAALQDMINQYSEIFHV